MQSPSITHVLCYSLYCVPWGPFRAYCMRGWIVSWLCVTALVPIALVLLHLNHFGPPQPYLECHTLQKYFLAIRLIFTTQAPAGLDSIYSKFLSGAARVPGSSCFQGNQLLLVNHFLIHLCNHLSGLQWSRKGAHEMHRKSNPKEAMRDSSQVVAYRYESLRKELLLLLNKPASLPI